ncbi:MAG: YHYH protein [Candidatus Kapabacteria bacterium]|nr:YHYH protein [Candidatus Kapabacteria bacterium]
MIKHIIVAALIIAASSITAAGHADHGKGPLPEWRLRTGRHIHGSFHSAHLPWIVLEGRHGKTTAVRLSDFSEKDQQSLTQRIEAIQDINAPRQLHLPHAPEVGLQQVPPVVTGIAWIAGAVFLLIACTRRRTPALRWSAAMASVFMTILAASPQTIARLEEILSPTPPQSIDSTFAAYKPLVKTRWDATYFYVESNGMPTAMPAMKGITAWQQQVPIPQPYTGPNAWAIPLNPVIADVPVSLDTALHTGAVAIAANGIPVFNPENNRGEFSQDIGELDAFGGHCGRADDYHYHIAPVHLAAKRDPKLPVAWALDGYPLFGYNEPDGSTATGLDQHLGHIWNGQYHYHAIDKKPYMIASMRGKVTVQNDQVMPQPRAAGVRTFLQALRGASITDFRKCDSNHYVLRYEVGGKTNFVNYRWDSTGKNFVFNFVKTDSGRTTANYTRK